MDLYLHGMTPGVAELMPKDVRPDIVIGASRAGGEVVGAVYLHRTPRYLIVDWTDAISGLSEEDLGFVMDVLHEGMFMQAALHGLPLLVHATERNGYMFLDRGFEETRNTVLMAKPIPYLMESDDVDARSPRQNAQPERHPGREGEPGEPRAEHVHEPKEEVGADASEPGEPPELF